MGGEGVRETGRVTVRNELVQLLLAQLLACALCLGLAAYYMLLP